MDIVVSIVSVAAAIWMARRWPRLRRQMLVGGAVSVVVPVLDVVMSGGWVRLGTTFVDAVRAVGLLIAVSCAGGAILAVAYEQFLGRRFGPSVHPDRIRVWWVALGIPAALVAWVLGATLPLGALIGLAVSALITLVVTPRLAWDLLRASIGVAAWFMVVEAVVGLRRSGDIARIALTPEPLGVTVLGLPVEQVITAGFLGLLLGPVIVALKPWRTPWLPKAREVHRPTVVLGVGLLIVVIVITSVIVWSYVLPPRVAAISPADGTVDVNSPAGIQLTFTRPINRDSLTVALDPAVDGSWRFEQPSLGAHGYRRARFEPARTLVPSTTYTVHVRGIASVVGFAGPDQSARFTTAALPSVTAVTTVPSTGGLADANGVPLTDPCQPLTVQLTSALKSAGELSFAFDPAIAFTAALDSSQTLYTLTPSSCLLPGTAYHLRVLQAVVVRDPMTNEVVERGDPLMMFDQTFSTTPAPVVAPVVPPAPVPSPPSAPAPPPIRHEVILPIALDYQDQPLSCEAAALKMALSGVGVRVSEKQIMAVVGYDPTPRRKGVWGDPNQAFVGNIAGKQNSTGYGVHWDPIARAANRWRTARSVTNMNVGQLATEIAAGHPVVVWGTTGSARRDTWRTPSGTKIEAWKGEHARTVIGFRGSVDQPTHIILNDPLAGRLVWTVEAFEQNWSTFHNSAVVVE